MSDQLRDLVRPVGEFDPPLDLPARINARERELVPGRRPARVPRMLVRVAAVAGVLLILGVLALAAHSREQQATPAKSTFPAHIVLSKQPAAISALAPGFGSSCASGTLATLIAWSTCSRGGGSTTAASATQQGALSR